MNEKTEELRDIFMDVTDEETVTESQESTHGSLTSESEVEARLLDAVADMRENLEFATSLDDDALATVVRQFYAGESDADVASELDTTSKTVARARADLHLLRDSDTDAPINLDRLHDLRESDATVAEMADELDVSESTVRRYRRVLDTQAEIRQTNDRYRAEFENTLQDRELSERLTSSVHEDGLDGATEGQETDMTL